MAQETSTAPVVAPQETQDFMPLNGVDHVELYVGNALQAAYYYTRAFGFQEVAYRGLETGTRDLVSHVVQQGRIRLVLTGALHSDSAIAAHQHKHGDGVKVIALSVPDAEHAYREATARGAVGVVEPHEVSDEHGTVKLATIQAYGETLHTFVERGAYHGAFLPGYEAVDRGPRDSGLLLGIDHIVADGKGRVKFPINEPAEGKRKSQIDEYLEFYEGAGAQHIAVATRDIVGTVAELRHRGVEFLTIFFEVIERHGARGFGDGNFKALFEAIEREQERRGNL